MIKIDVRGKSCPLPVIEAKKILKKNAGDETILVIVDNEIAKENLEKMAKVMGHKCESEIISNEHFEIKIIKGLGSETLVEKVSESKFENKVVVISSETMGMGNDELGAILMKGFIYALTELEKLPSKIIFYNGGVKLVTKNSQALEDLKALESEGVEIFSCGTCLDFNKLADERAVGSVTNMYDIVEMMSNAEQVIKP